MGAENDEPLTPAGRLFVRPEINQSISCILGTTLPIDINTVKTELSNSIMLQHPRFCSLMVTDRNGREHWRRTQIDLNRHIIIRHDPVGESAEVADEEAVNDYVADLSVSSPLSLDKPLWELHLLMAHKCIVFRVHHALGDGISLMSMLLSCCRRADDPSQRPTVDFSSSSSPPKRRTSRRFLGWKAAKFVWFTIVFSLEFVLRSLWKKDKRTAVSGGEGVELWPRKLVTAKFKIDDMKTVKTTVTNATINDVLLAVVSAGLSKYLDIRSPKSVPEGLQITGLAMVNLRPQPGLQELSNLMKNKSGTRWGNKFGVVLLPIYYHRHGKSDPLQFVKRAKAMVDQKKQSLEAIFSYKIGDLIMSCFGSKIAALLNYRIVCNTTFTMSNVIGPREEITIAGIPVTHMRVNTASLPHAITMHMLSYAGNADMQILVAKDIIPDPEVLAKCFEDSLLEMKEAAMATLKT